MGHSRAFPPKARLTGRGWQVLAIGFSALVAAQFSGAAQLYQLSYAMLALLLAALPLALVGGGAVGVERRVPGGARLTAGRPARVELIVSNGSARGTPPLEIADWLLRPTVLRVAPLPGGAERVQTVPIHPERRGVYEVGPAEVLTTDPFGLLRLSRPAGGRARLVVYPPAHDLRDFPLLARPGARPGARTGDRGRASRPPAQEDGFAGIREYRKGDEWRRIHWKGLARTGTLQVREHEAHAEGRPPRYAVALDLGPPDPGSSEREVEDAVSAAASVLKELLLKERLAVRLLCGDRARSATGFATGEAGFWEAMGTLAAARADGTGDLADALPEGRERFPAGLGEGVVLVSRVRGDGRRVAELAERLLAAGIAVAVVAVASHTYRGAHYLVRPAGGQPGCRDDEFQGSEDRDPEEAAFAAALGRLRRAGAAVRVVGSPDGAAGLANGENG